VNRAPFSHIGGAVIADHGAIGLVEARRLASLYAAEAKAAAKASATRWAGLCAGRALALAAAAEAAARWRRAAGWADPRTADEARRNGHVG
jgi:hypothetical protein